MADGDDFFKLSKRLKAAGEVELRQELHKAMTAAARPLIPKVKEAARQKLPKRGGLNERTARKPLRAQTRTGVKTAGVRIVGSKVDPRINEGRIWHPVFGDRTPGAVQDAPEAKGYFDETLAGSAPEVRATLAAVMASYVERLARPL